MRFSLRNMLWATFWFAVSTAAFARLPDGALTHLGDKRYFQPWMVFTTAAFVGVASLLHKPKVGFAIGVPFGIAFFFFISMFTVRDG